MKNTARSLKFGASTLALTVSALLYAGAAAAQAPGAVSASEVEEVVVTGTSIRGVAPIGSNLIAVGREQIEDTSAQTVQQILRSVPALTGSGATPQGGNPGNAFYAPTIHSLGSSSSNSTLVIIDGHRFSPGSQQQTLTDPNIVPPIALERVEVLAEGASSVYGSDAVAGVVNFITRRTYDGVMITGQTGWADGGYRTYNGGIIAGTRDDNSSIYVAYNYSDRGNLATAERAFLNRNHIPQGGTNFGNFNCSPATIQPQGVSGIYLSPTAATPVTNTAANAPCNLLPFGDAIPHEIRHNAMLKARQEFGDKLSVGLDVVYSRVTNTTQTSRGTIQSTVFRTRANQANPFYVNPPGVAAGTTAGDQQTVRWSADDLLGPGATNFNNAIDYYAALDAEYKLDDNFRLTALAVYGREDSLVGNQGQLCASCANLALNGTTNAAGSLTTPSIVGTNVIVLQTLTPENALDVWTVGSANRTSAATRAKLVDNYTRSLWNYSIAQARVGLDGNIFTLPGGPVKMAIGAEYVFYDLEMNRNRPNNTGPASTGSEFFHLYLERNVKSAYGELFIPIVGPDNEMPGIRRMDLSLSGRYDDYSLIGTTTNPRVALGWEVFEGLRLRSNYSRSFVAPQLSSVGDRTRGGLTSFSGYGGTTGSFSVPVASFPLAAAVPGVTCTNGQCVIGGTINGVSMNGGPADPQPGKGESWSLGADFSPLFMPGFRAGVTLFNTKLINQITGTSVSNSINSAALNNKLRFCPAGCTVADIEAVAGTSVSANFPQTSAIGSPIYFVSSVRQENVLNLDIQGIDADFTWRIPTDSLGTFNLGGSISYFTKFDQNIKGGPTFSVLGSTGFNNTFPSIRTQARANAGWEMAGFSADLFFNYVSGYRNWSASTVLPLVSQNGNPVSGGDKVESTQIFDVNFTYTLSGHGLDGSQIFLNIDNIGDKDPVFYNSATGVDQYSGNILGRVVTVGFRAKF